MRARHIGVLGFAGGLVVLWLGCSGERPSPPVYGVGPAYVPKYGRARGGEACALDADCRSGFCDRTTCLDPEGLYGSPCNPPPADAEPVAKLPENQRCDGLLCLEGRCRSCRSDAECEAYYGMGKCLVRGIWNGEWYAQCSPTTTRVPVGYECVVDDQCKTLFCDRGRCAYSRRSATDPYGAACVPGPPKPVPEDLRVAPPEGTCEGYLCVDARCRSCLSDAECQEGSSDLKCIYFSRLAGKVCATENQAKRPFRDWEEVGPKAPGPYPSDED
jgi:hypothetical protein